jgi:hypothetical protein
MIPSGPAGWVSSSEVPDAWVGFVASWQRQPERDGKSPVDAKSSCAPSGRSCRQPGSLRSLGISRNAVDPRLFRAKRRLADQHDRRPLFPRRATQTDSGERWRGMRTMSKPACVRPTRCQRTTTLSSSSPTSSTCRSPTSEPRGRSHGDRAGVFGAGARHNTREHWWTCGLVGLLDVRWACRELCLRSVGV